LGDDRYLLGLERQVDLVLIGAGRVGTAVAVLLQRSGHRFVGVASRSPEGAQRAADLLGAPIFDTELMPSADAALVGVPVDQLERVGVKLASLHRTEIVCHFAGSVGLAPLRAAAEVGMSVAALHPVQTCPDVDTAVQLLPGSAWGVTTSPAIGSWARTLIIQDLHGLPVEVAEHDRALWHAAAVSTAGGLAALMSLGERMLSEIGVADPSRVLGPLAAGVITIASAAGEAGSVMTGPVVRGEVGIIRAQVEALSRSPELLEGYCLTMRTILLAALRADRIDGAMADTIGRALEE
jgi:predicted short-subunit dehydrogenase-like oxidoreductase (DUF2520 family)